MGNNYSKLSMCGTCAVFSVAYHIIFWKLFAYSQAKKTMTPKRCLLLSTNTISTIHSLLVTLPSFIDFVCFRRWENPIFGEPHIGGYVWATAIAYLLVDLLAHFVCFVAYDSKVIPRRWDTIIHHLVAIVGFCCIQIPDPIHFWGCFDLIMASELSTIFLNTQWFGKYFQNKKLEKISQALFFVTWIFVRLPIFVYVAYIVIKYRKKIIRQLPARIYIPMLTTVTPAILLQIIWTVFIVWKICYAVYRKQDWRPPPRTLHGVSVEMKILPETVKPAVIMAT